MPKTRKRTMYVWDCFIKLKLNNNNNAVSKNINNNSSMNPNNIDSNYNKFEELLSQV